MILHQLDNSVERRHYNAYIYNNRRWVNHFHKCYELIYAMDDNVKITLNGKVVTDNIEADMLLIDFLRSHGCYSLTFRPILGSLRPA